MKYLALTVSLASVLLTSACADQYSHQKSSWLCCGIPPLEWPERHWEYMAQENHIRNHDEILPAALDRSRSMFDAEKVKNLSPDEFIVNLKNADIIDSVYRDNNWLDFDLTGSILYEGFQTGTDKYDVMKVGPLIADLDYNFYTLARADQVVITELLLQSYDTEFMLLKDVHTHKIVGEITSDRGFVLF